MKPINEIQDICNFAATISLNNLMIYWIDFLKTQSNNKQILKTYDKMVGKLKKKYVKEFDDPFSIAEKEFGIGSGQLFLPIVDIHQIYYFDVLKKLDEYFMNEIAVLSNEGNFQIECKFIWTNLQIAFHIPQEVTHHKEGRLSTFHNLKGKYATWLLSRKSTKIFIDNNFEKLEKLVVKYS